MSLQLDLITKTRLPEFGSARFLCNGMRAFGEDAGMRAFGEDAGMRAFGEDEGMRAFGESLFGKKLRKNS